MAQSTLPERGDIPQAERWRLDHLYATQEEWEAAYARVSAGFEEFSGLSGTLGTPDGLYRALHTLYALSEELESLSMYAQMLRDQDNADARGQAAHDRAETLGVRAASAQAFLQPEVLALPEAVVAAARTEERFAPYRRAVEGMLRLRAHTLTREEESILAAAGELAQAPVNIYSMFSYADLKYATIEGEGGEPVEVTDGRYGVLIRSRDRGVRKRAYEAMFTARKAYENTMAATLSAEIKAHNMEARLRGYASPLESALFPKEVPVPVFDSLIAAVKAAKPAMTRYAEYRARKLGLDKLAYYDLYVPLSEGFEIKLPYDAAYDLVADALAPLGEGYAAVLRQAKTGGWIDVHETRGKTSGAYMMPSFRKHPFVLLNHQETLDAAMTIAHEMGHAMHTYYSVAAQPYPTADYPIFLAEVASTVNEDLMVSELLRRNPQPDAQRMLLGHRLEDIRTTVIRQTMFADFERRAHDLAWAGEALTAQALCALYAETLADYYGPPVEPDELIPCEWMRIPHMYMNFYVFQYATGYSAASAIARRIMGGDAAYVKDYLRFLSLGGSLPPLEALRVAGLDMATPTPVADCLKTFEETLDALIALD